MFAHDREGGHSPAYHTCTCTCKWLLGTSKQIMRYGNVQHCYSKNEMRIKNGKERERTKLRHLRIKMECLKEGVCQVVPR